MNLAIIALCLSARLAHGHTEGSVKQGSNRVLEIYHNGKWGPICAGKGWWNWNGNYAKIACRMLDYENGEPGIRRSYLSTEALLRGVECSGNERNIEDCRHDGWGKYYCRRLLTIRCNGGKFSGTACSGRVCEDYHNKCCDDNQGSRCCSGRTTSASTTTTKNHNDHPPKWVISFRWWWITAVVIAVAVIAAITLLLTRYCREHRCLRAQCHVGGRQDVTLPHGGVHRAAVLPLDLPPSYSDVSKVSRRAATGAKCNPVFQQDEPEPPPPPYFTIET